MHLFRALSTHPEHSVTISKGENQLACRWKDFSAVLFRKKKYKKNIKKQKTNRQKKKLPLFTELASHFRDRPSFCFDKCTVVQRSDVTWWLTMLTCLRFLCFDWCFSVSGRLQSVGPTHWKKIINNNYNYNKTKQKQEITDFSCILVYVFFLSIQCTVWNVLLSITLYRLITFFRVKKEQTWFFVFF